MTQTALFDGSFDGLLCVVHAHFYDKLNPQNVLTADNVQDSLDTDFITIETDFEKSLAVFNAIREKVSEIALERCYHASLSEIEAVYMAVYKYILHGFKIGRPIDDCLTVDYVAFVNECARKVYRESHLLKGFCRFVKASNFYYSYITPKYFVLPILAGHFSDRFKTQNWVIIDKNRYKAAVYNQSVLEIHSYSGKLEISEDDSDYEGLWKIFTESIAIKDRINTKLQRQMLPLYFRTNMTEFVPQSKVHKNQNLPFSEKKLSEISSIT